MAKPKTPKQTREEPLETQLWNVADKLRKNIDASAMGATMNNNSGFLETTGVR